PERLRKKIEQLDRDIDRGEDNILRADHTLLPGLSAKLAVWKKEREQLAQEEAKLQGATIAVEALCKQALHELWQLREALHSDDPKDLRAVLHEVVDRIELFFTHQPQGKRRRSTFSHGTIYLKSYSQSLHLRALGS